MGHIKKIGKGITKQFPFAKTILEEYDAEEIQELKKKFHTEKIVSMGDLIDAINSLNPNTGRNVIIKKMIHTPKIYRREERDTNGFYSYNEYFDARGLKVEIRKKGDSEYFTGFLINLIFHNDDRDTTIHEVSLSAFTEDKKTSTIPDMIKLDDGKWETFDMNEFTCRINKNTSKRLFFRFISKDFIEEPLVLTKFRLEHTSGKFELVDSSKFTENIENVKWASGSDGSGPFIMLS